MTEQDLRDTLQRKASGLHAAPDLELIERRGRRMRRNKRLVTAAGPLAAVVAIAVAVPLLSSPSASGHRGPLAKIVPASAPAASTFDPADPWAFRGDTGAVTPGVQAAWAKAHPGTTETPLFGHVVDGVKEVVVASADRWGITRTSAAGVTTLVIDQPLRSDQLALAARVYTGFAPRLVVVAAPHTAIMIDDVAVTEAASGVVDDGQVDGVEGKAVSLSLGTVAEGPITVATGAPGNVLHWLVRGKANAPLLAEALESYAAGRESNQEPQVHVLLASSTGKSQLLLAQMWLPGDTEADTYGFVTHSDASPGEPQLLKVLPVDARLAALDFTEPGGEELAIVPAAPDDVVSYAADGTSFLAQVKDANGIVLITRGEIGPTATDVVRISPPTGAAQDFPVFTLLCGKTSCG